MAKQVKKQLADAAKARFKAGAPVTPTTADGEDGDDSTASERELTVKDVDAEGDADAKSMHSAAEELHTATDDVQKDGWPMTPQRADQKFQGLLKKLRVQLNKKNAESRATRGKVATCAYKAVKDPDALCDLVGSGPSAEALLLWS